MRVSSYMHDMIIICSCSTEVQRKKERNIVLRDTCTYVHLSFKLPCISLNRKCDHTNSITRKDYVHAWLGS